MGEDKSANVMMAFELAEKLPMVIRDFLQGSRLVGLQGFDAAIQEPEGGRRRPQERICHHDLMVSPESHEVSFLLQLEEPFNHSL